MSESPFDLDSPRAYRAWRGARLRRLEGGAEWRGTPFDPAAPAAALERLAGTLARANVAGYSSAAAFDPGTLLALCAGLGLRRLDAHYLAGADGVATLSDRPQARAEGLIPYSPRALNWHTDGYYHDPSRPVRAFALHCVRPAASGGENRLLDHELAYLLLRDREPRWIAALSRPDVLGIPAHVVDGRERRPAVRGPVFAVLADGRLHMRYTERTRNVAWSADPAVTEARACLAETLRGDHPYVLSHRLQAGEGIVAANVLHCRTAFADPPGVAGRTLYRARFLDPTPGATR